MLLYGEVRAMAEEMKVIDAIRKSYSGAWAVRLRMGSVCAILNK